MTTFDQLEIISAGGLIEFFDLHPARGLTNIGSHPENDIVLPGANVAPFHLVIDHRITPAHLLVLTTDHCTTLDNVSVSPERPWPLQNWASIEFGGYTLILLQNGSGARPTPVSPGATGLPSVTPSVTPTVMPGVTPPMPSPVQSRPGMTPGDGVGNIPQVTGIVYPPVPVQAAPTNGASSAASASPVGVDWSEPQHQHRLLSPVREHVDELILVEMGER